MTDGWFVVTTVGGTGCGRRRLIGGWQRVGRVAGGRWRIVGIGLGWSVVGTGLRWSVVGTGLGWSVVGISLGCVIVVGVWRRSWIGVSVVGRRNWTVIIIRDRWIGGRG